MNDIPGLKWRVLAHCADGPFEAENQGRFDELVVDDWLHVEQMDDSKWWIRVGDAEVWIEIPERGDVVVNVQRGYFCEVNGSTLILDD